MPRRKVEPETVEPIVEVPAPVEPAEAVATAEPPTEPPADEEPDEYGPNLPKTKAEEPEQETEPEPTPETVPAPAGFVRVIDPYAPNSDVVLRYPLPEVVTVTASWLSEAEAKVLRAQHQPTVDAANAVPETKGVNLAKE